MVFRQQKERSITTTALYTYNNTNDNTNSIHNDDNSSIILIMDYKLSEIAEMMKIYVRAEAETKDYLFLSASSMKNKEPKIKSAQRTIKAIEEYKKLPLELRKEIEKDTNMSRIEMIEKLCQETIKTI